MRRTITADRRVVGRVSRRGDRDPRHNDHINAAGPLADALGSPVWLHPRLMLWRRSIPIGIPTGARRPDDGDGGWRRARVLHTPVTLRGMLLPRSGEQVVFSGDTLFRGVGATDELLGLPDDHRLDPRPAPRPLRRDPRPAGQVRRRPSRPRRRTLPIGSPPRRVGMSLAGDVPALDVDRAGRGSCSPGSVDADLSTERRFPPPHPDGRNRRPQALSPAAEPPAPGSSTGEREPREPPRIHQFHLRAPRRERGRATRARRWHREGCRRRDVARTLMSCSGQMRVTRTRGRG